MSDAERKQPSFDLRAHLACDPGTLVFLSTAFAFSSALFSAVELGAFDALEGKPATLDELAQRLSVPAPALDRLVVLLHSLGLLDRDEHGRYHNAQVASAMLTRSSPHSLRAFLLHQQRHMYPLFEHLTDALRTGEAQTHRWSFAGSPSERAGYAALADSPDDNHLFLEAMNAMAVGVGTVIAREVDFTKIRTLADLGGGGGQIAIELAEAVPHLQITIVDGADACRFADEIVAARGLSARIHTCTGDFLARLPDELGAFDAVLLGGVLADWDASQQRTLLGEAHRILAPGGRLLVSETLLDEDRTGPVLPALLSLAMLVGTRGRNFTPSELTAIIARAGFEHARVISNRAAGVRDLVIASRS